MNKSLLTLLAIAAVVMCSCRSNGTTVSVKDFGAIPDDGIDDRYTDTYNVYLFHNDSSFFQIHSTSISIIFFTNNQVLSQNTKGAEAYPRSSSGILSTLTCSATVPRLS